MAQRSDLCTRSHQKYSESTLMALNKARAVTGPPTLCVMFCVLEMFGGGSDFVLTGINPGANAGRAVSASRELGELPGL